jgi:hypothetical protein
MICQLIGSRSVGGYRNNSVTEQGRFCVRMMRNDDFDFIWRAALKMREKIVSFP